MRNFCVLMELLLQVDLNFSLGAEKTIVSSKIAVFPRVEGSPTLFSFSISLVKSISVFVTVVTSWSFEQIYSACHKILSFFWSDALHLSLLVFSIMLHMILKKDA